MPYGSGRVIRMAVLSAKPWQRYLICVAMIALGALLVAVGHVAGAALAAAGVLLGWTMIRHSVQPRAGSAQPSASGGDGSAPDGEGPARAGNE